MGGCAERCFRPASANARRLTMAALVTRRAGEVQRWAQDHGLDAQRYAVYGADVADTESIAAGRSRPVSVAAATAAATATIAPTAARA